MDAFALFTDPEQMQAVFQQRLPCFAHGQREITSCTILHSFRKTYLKAASLPRSFSALVYRLQLTDRLSGSRHTLLLYAKAYLGARSQQVFEQAVHERLTQPSIGVAVTHLADLGLVVWTFPNDPSLPQLIDAIEPQRVVAHLPYAALPAAVDGPHHVSSVAVDVLNYHPELRCTARYTLQCQPSLEPLRIYGKTYADGQGQALEQLINRFGSRGAARPGDFARPRALGYSPEIGTLWLAALSGVPVATVIDRQTYERLLDAIAHGLANLHRADPAGLPRLHLHDRLAETLKKIGKLAHAFPQLGPTLDALAHDLADNQPAHNPADDRLIHGDFHLHQLLLDGDTIGLLDFDDLACGDPLQDIAHFIADMHHQRFEPDFVEQMTAAFVHAYGTWAAWDVPIERLNWHLSTQFVARAYRAYVQQKPNLEHTIRALLVCAQQGIAVARR